MVSPPVLAGFGRAKVKLKVLLTACVCGVSASALLRRTAPPGPSPRPRGLPRPASQYPAPGWSIPLLPVGGEQRRAGGSCSCLVPCQVHGEVEGEPPVPGADGLGLGKDGPSGCRGAGFSSPLQQKPRPPRSEYWTNSWSSQIAGRHPVKSLLPSWMVSMLLRLASSCGTSPVMRFPWRFILIT